MGFRPTEIEYEIANFFFSFCVFLIRLWKWVHLYYILKFLWARTLWSINTSPNPKELINHYIVIGWIILEVGPECRSGWYTIGFDDLDHWSPNAPLKKLLEGPLNLADEGLPICELESNSELNLIYILHQRRVIV